MMMVMQYYRFYHKFVLVTYLLNLLASIPLPVYNFVRFTSILFFYAFDYTGLGLGLTVLWSHSHPYPSPQLTVVASSSSSSC